MGKEIEKLALGLNHTVVCVCDNENDWLINTEKLKKADVVIDFSMPQFAVINILNCFELHIPIVIGTTGWYNEIEDITAKCELLNGSLFYASNFSIGMNLFYAVNEHLAALMNSFTDYDLQIEETHHTQKLDSPSGTSITLANQIIQKLNRKSNWAKEQNNNTETLTIKSNREENITGTHTITYCSDEDTIEIKHTAHNRKGFAHGAIKAAGWIIGKNGVYTMKDMIY